MSAYPWSSVKMTIRFGLEGSIKDCALTLNFVPASFTRFAVILNDVRLRTWGAIKLNLPSLVFTIFSEVSNDVFHDSTVTFCELLSLKSFTVMKTVSSEVISCGRVIE